MLRFITRLFTAIAVIWSATVQADMLVDLKDGDTIRVTRVDENQKIKIDGHLNEPVWQTLPAYDEFVVIQPDTLADVQHATQVRMFYTSEGLYVGVDMAQPAGTLYKRLSGRDQRQINRDNINITLDTSGEGRYGYWFGIS